MARDQPERSLCGASGTWAERLALYRSLTAADASRNKSPESMATLRVWRANQVLQQPTGVVASLLARLVQVANIVWVRLLMGAELPGQVMAGPGIELPHGGRGVILHPTVVIGDNVTIYHRVTVGVVDGRSAPRIGDDVVVGVGATLLGPIDIAVGARIGAGAVMISDAAPDTAYVGVPAREVGEG